MSHLILFTVQVFTRIRKQGGNSKNNRYQPLCISDLKDEFSLIMALGGYQTEMAGFKISEVSEKNEE
jgi:hypothetical protein